MKRRPADNSGWIRTVLTIATTVCLTASISIGTALAMRPPAPPPSDPEAARKALAYCVAGINDAVRWELLAASAPGSGAVVEHVELGSAFVEVTYRRADGSELVELYEEAGFLVRVFGYGAKPGANAFDSARHVFSKIGPAALDCTMALQYLEQEMAKDSARQLQQWIYDRCPPGGQDRPDGRCPAPPPQAPAQPSLVPTPGAVPPSPGSARPGERRGDDTAPGRPDGDARSPQRPPQPEAGSGAPLLPLPADGAPRTPADDEEKSAVPQPDHEPDPPPETEPGPEVEPEDSTCMIPEGCGPGADDDESGGGDVVAPDDPDHPCYEAGGTPEDCGSAL